MAIMPVSIFNLAVNQIEKSESAEAEFLKKLFGELEQSGVRYAVMRNYEQLPFSLAGSDLDILIDPKQEKLAKACIIKAIETTGGVPIGCVNTVGLFKVFAFGKACKPNDEWWGLRMDITFGMICAGGLNIIGDSVWSDNLEEHNGISVLSRDLAAVIGVIKELLYNNRLPKKYLDRSFEVVSKPDRLSSILSALSPMGEEVLGLIGKLCIEKPNSRVVVRDSRLIRRSLEYKALWNSPFSYLIKKVMYYGSRVSRIVKPPGKMVAILGTDGSGKSTVINAISPVLMHATHGALTIQHLRPRLFPSLGSLKQSGVVEDDVVTDPHAAKPSGYFLSMVRLIYYLIDYIIGYWVRVRPQISKNPTIFLFDRYAYDLLIDPKRLRINLPEWVLRVFTLLVPTPDLIICLHGDPVVLTARKKELPLSEVRRQVEALIAFSKKEKKAVSVSTELPISDTRDLILEAIKSTCKA